MKPETLKKLSTPCKITITAAAAAALALCLPHAASLAASAAPPAAPPADTSATFRADSFTPTYGYSLENIIPLDSLRSLPLNIELRDGIYQAAPPKIQNPKPKKNPKSEIQNPPSTFTLGQSFPNGQFSESALLEIFQTIARHYNQLGIFGVFVVVHREDIDPQTHEDYRPPERKDLRLTIWVSRVGDMRTLAKGSRIPQNQSVDNPAHRLISQYSPLQPDPNTTRPGSHLRKDLIDNYLLDLNRHPARRVDAALSAGSSPGEITLDYLVTERRPWFAYAQLTDSGAGRTDNLRAHAGFTHYQLTNHDDILQLDAAAGVKFSEGFSASAAYDRPVIFPSTLRARAALGYSEYAAEDLAIGLDKFTGYSASATAEASWSPLRFLGCSLDILPALVWQKYHNYDSSSTVSTGASFIAACLAARLQRDTDTLRSALRVGIETNLSSISERDLPGLGRSDAKGRYNILTLDTSHSLFIEPLLYGEKFYDGSNWRKSARAHEVAFSARAQLSLDNNRLIPQKTMTVGGMYSVRGYPGAIVGGDNVWMATLEYRLHIPRLFRPYTALPRDRGDPAARPSYFGIPFNWRAPALHALPDWDFILRVFGDAGRASIIDPLSFESSHTLASVGLGLEAQIKGVLNIRVDWGLAQKPVSANGHNVAKNDSQFHFSASILW